MYKNILFSQTLFPIFKEILADEVSSIRSYATEKSFKSTDDMFTGMSQTTM